MFLILEHIPSMIAAMDTISQMAMETIIRAEIHRASIHRECQMRIGFVSIR